MSFSHKPLRKISNNDFLHDVKKYIKNTHEFYTDKLPEMNIMAQRLHDEYTLQEFYRVFTKLWHSGSGERSLAIHTLQLYHKEFDIATWHFILGRLDNVTSLDEARYMGEIMSSIYLKDTSIKRGILELSEQKNQWIRRVAFFCLYDLLKRKQIKETHIFLRIVEKNMYDSDETMQNALGKMLQMIGKMKKEALKRFILKHKKMPEGLFRAASSSMPYLRKMRKIKKLNNPLPRR